MFHNIDIANEELKEAARNFRKKQRENLEFALAKIKQDADYKFWFIVNNIIAITAFIEGSSKIEYDDSGDHNYNPIGIKAGAFDIEHIRYSMLYEIYSNEPKEYLYVKVNENSSCDVKIIDIEDYWNNGSGSIKFEINDTFIFILNNLNITNMANLLDAKCENCKFKTICNKGKNCVFNTAGGVKDV